MAPMRPAKMSNLTAIVIDIEMDSALRFIASTGVVHFADVKESKKKHLKSLNPVEASERYYYLSNLQSRIATLIAEMNINRGGKVKDPLKVPAIPDEAHFQNMEKDLKAIEDDYNDLSQRLTTAGAKEDKKTAKTVKKEIKAVAEQHRLALLGWEELASREHKLEETKLLFGKTERTYVMYGWIPTKQVKKFTHTVEAQKDLSISLTIHEHTDKPQHDHYPADTGPLEGEIEPEEPTAPPTKQTNPRWLRSFQNLTNAFGVPDHTEIDPAWFMALGFPIFFGLMFGDIGHGILLFLFAFLGFIAKRRKVDAGEMVNYFIQGSGMIMVIAIASIFFGVLYGEFLGIDITGLQLNGVYVYQQLKYSPFGEGMKNILLMLFRFFDFDGGVNWFIDPLSPYNAWILDPLNGHTTPIWFSAFEMPEHLPINVSSPTWILFVLSIIIGFIHLSIAIGFDVINKVRHRDWKHAIFGPLIWLWFLWGFAYMIFQFGINFMSWPMTEMLLLLILPAVILFVGGIFAFGIMDGFMEGLEKLIASISNTISYSRILALNMAHAGFAKTFIFLAGIGVAEIMTIMALLQSGNIMSIVMFVGMLVLGTVFILLMEGLLSFIHTLRLHWVEAFLKFYAGTGREYNPLTMSQYWTTTSN